MHRAVICVQNLPTKKLLRLCGDGVLIANFFLAAMDDSLHFSENDVRQQLDALGYHNVPSAQLRQFARGEQTDDTNHMTFEL